MQPRPSPETSSPPLPRRRVCIAAPFPGTDRESTPTISPERRLPDDAADRPHADPVQRLGEQAHLRRRGRPAGRRGDPGAEDPVQEHGQHAQPPVHGRRDLAGAPRGPRPWDPGPEDGPPSGAPGPLARATGDGRLVRRVWRRPERGRPERDGELHADRRQRRDDAPRRHPAARREPHELSPRLGRRHVLRGAECIRRPPTCRCSCASAPASTRRGRHNARSGQQRRGRNLPPAAGYDRILEPRPRGGARVRAPHARPAHARARPRVLLRRLRALPARRQPGDLGGAGVQRLPLAPPRPPDRDPQPRSVPRGAPEPRHRFGCRRRVGRADGIQPAAERAARRHAEHGQDQRRGIQVLRARVRGAGRGLRGGGARVRLRLPPDHDHAQRRGEPPAAPRLPARGRHRHVPALAPRARAEPHARGPQPHRRPVGAAQPDLLGADRVRRDGALPAQPPRRVAADDRRRSLQADQRPARAPRGRPGDPQRRRDREPDGAHVGPLRPLRRRGVRRRAARHRRRRRRGDRRAHSPADRGGRRSSRRPASGAP